MSVEDCVRYTLTIDPDVALLGMSFPNEQDAALAAAESFTPIASTDLAALRRARGGVHTRQGRDLVGSSTWLSTNSHRR